MVSCIHGASEYWTKCSFKHTPSSELVNAAYILSRNDLSRPALMLPGASKPVVAVRFCPVRFSLRGLKSSDFFRLPYRLIFALATLNSLDIYDTEGIEPIAILAGLHYAAITDIAWSPNGKYLALSSQDGYCTLLEFQNQELGSSVPVSEERNIVDDCKTLQQAQGASFTKTEPDNGLDGAESEKAEAHNDEKQASTATLATPTANKPAKRRITPIVID
ncbi:unnamed protein product [Coffea canephora]|uniref:CAF1B/HIR1 beta-propeller domain-containing protein n=1 Tax=Coffea canephora TaxID=49390 RepID=A0A068UVV1_COFCA|nr:unnamed protein product [Coffea canephora]